MKKLYKIIAVLMATLIMVPWLALASDAEGETGGGESGESAESSSTQTTAGCGHAGDSEYLDCEDDEIAVLGQDDELIFMCNTGQYKAFTYSVSVDKDNYDATTNANNEETALLTRLLEDFEKGFDQSNSDNPTACGEVNPYTGDVQMRDCAAEKKVVTEITQVFADSTTLGEEARVVSLQKGTCCYIAEEVTKDGETYHECRDLRSQYFPDIDTCYDNSLFCSEVQWIIGDSGASIIKLYIKQIYMWAAGTIGFIAVITIVINGIRISVSGATGDITQAKERILQSISGLVLLFLSGLILYTINPTFFS